MKKIYLFIGFTIGLSSWTQAQIKDNGQPTNTPLEKKVIQRIQPKSGESLGEYCGYSLTTAPPGGDNANTGIMFDVEAINDLFVVGFSVQLHSGYTGKIYVYRKNNTHVGFENTAGDWTLVDSAMVIDAGGLTYIPIETGPSIGAGSVAAFYIKGEGNVSDIDYANGTAVGNTLVANSDLNLKTGSGINGLFGSIAVNRDFKGAIHYCKNTSVSCDTMQTSYNDDNGNAGIYFDVETTTNSVEIKRIFTDFSIPTATKQNVKLYTKQGTHDGSEGSNVGWTLLSDVDIISPLPDQPEAVSDSLTLIIPPNTVQGFFILTDGNGLSYTNGVTTGDIVVDDPKLKLKTGKGTSGTFGSSLNAARILNGSIDYCIISGLGVNEYGQKLFSVSPNPVQDEIHIQFTEGEIVEIQIVNEFGQIIQNEKLPYGITEYSVDVTQLARGTYFVKSANDDKYRVEKFIKL